MKKTFENKLKKLLKSESSSTINQIVELYEEMRKIEAMETIKIINKLKNSPQYGITYLKIDTYKGEDLLIFDNQQGEVYGKEPILNLLEIFIEELEEECSVS